MKKNHINETTRQVENVKGALVGRVLLGPQALHVVGYNATIVVPSGCCQSVYSVKNFNLF